MVHHNEGKEIVEFLSHVSAEAGRVLLSYFRRDLKIDAKDPFEGSIDIVTDADRASEELILEAIGKKFPDYDIMAEETPASLKGAGRLWVVDPLDGTVNFAHGYPVFCVSIALVEHGEPAVALVHDPLKNESFTAIRGSGAAVNGETIHVSRAERMDRSIVGTGFPYDRAISPDNNLAEFNKVMTKVQGVRRAGSAALDLAYVAAGRLDGFWELKLKPWDMAAGMLLVEEAGGRVTDRTGRPTDIYTSFVVATNGLIHDRLTEILNEPPQ